MKRETDKFDKKKKKSREGDLNSHTSDYEAKLLSIRPLPHL